MFRKLLLPSIFILGLVGIIYPTKKENTNIFDYCFSFEKILAKNTLESANNIDGRIVISSKVLASIGVENSRGNFIKEVIDSLKSNKENPNDLLPNFIPTKIYCLSGYWIEKFMPGTFESVFYEVSQEIIEKSYKDFNENVKEDINEFILELNNGYEIIKKEFNNILDL